MEILAKENKGKEALGSLKADDFKTFQLQIEINKKLGKLKNENVAPVDDELEAASQPEVMYVENIMFWLQTLEIKVQFSHFLKMTNFIQDLARILNASVHQVHYIFYKTDGDQVNNFQK